MFFEREVIYSKRYPPAEEELEKFSADTTLPVITPKQVETSFKDFCSRMNSEPHFELGVSWKPRWPWDCNYVGRYCMEAYSSDKRDQTADFLNTIQALSQLSYTHAFTFPEFSIQILCDNRRFNGQFYNFL